VIGLKLHLGAVQEGAITRHSRKSQDHGWDHWHPVSRISRSPMRTMSASHRPSDSAQQRLEKPNE
jgi:hypothetical protein